MYKRVVIGKSGVKAEVLIAIAKELEIDKSWLELHPQYSDIEKFDFKKCSNSLRIVLF